MTIFQHNKLLGIFHLIYGGATGLGLVGLLILAGFLAASFSVGLIELVLMFLVFINLLLTTTTSILAGSAFLKHKASAKTVGVVAAVVAGLNFPVGSALCVYTLWFLFGASGRFLYHKAAYALPAEPPLWSKAGNRERKREYVPPATPPDWR